MRTFNYIIISSILLFSFSASLFSQEKKNAQADTLQFLQGIWIEVDAAPLLESAVFNKFAYTMQGNIQLKLRKSYFPILELGFAGADKTTLDDVRFKTNGLFGKVGLDLALLKPKPRSTRNNNNFLGGIRLGMSHFNYSIYNQTITDNYWGESETYSLESIPTTKFWFEITAGLRVEVYKRIYMGWTVRNKHLINKINPGETAPWYIPGYGKGNSSAWGFSYCIGYKLR